MNPTALAEEAARVLRNGNKDCLLVLPRRIGRSRRMKVLHAKGMGTVFGEPVSENYEGHAVVAVKALDILAWLAAAGLVNVKAVVAEAKP